MIDLPRPDSHRGINHLELAMKIFAAFALFCLGSARADTFHYDASGRLEYSVQSNGMTHVFTDDDEGNILDATISASDEAPGGGAGNGIADWWENFYFNQQGIDPGGKDEDGISWLLKFGLGLEPGADGSALLPVIEAGSGEASLVFRRSHFADGLDFVVQSSTDLVLWSDLVAETDAVLNGPPLAGMSDDLAETFRLTVPYGGDRVFLRLRLLKP
jgi:hypothetical protein